MNQQSQPPSQFQSLPLNFCELSADLLDQSMLKIRHCFDQLSEDQLWWRPAPPLNSVGNLSLHIAGNLRQWGIVPFSEGGCSDDRDREGEFDREIRIAKAKVLNGLEEVTLEAKERWLKLPQDRLQEPVTIQGFDVTLMHAISHTSSHFVGHTHQIIMLTRMQLGDAYRFQWSGDGDRDRLPI